MEVKMYQPYINYEEYINMGGNTLTPENAEKYLVKASRHIDILTFGRINKFKFEKLTEYQQDIIKEVCMNLSDFEYENDDVLSSILSGYSINGVSISFNQNNWNLILQSGVAIKADDYALLSQTGLTTASLYY
jgi:hypothetical protein